MFNYCTLITLITLRKRNLDTEMGKTFPTFCQPSHRQMAKASTDNYLQRLAHTKDMFKKSLITSFVLI